MPESAKTAGVGLDLQALHACGADCGGDKADAWLAYRPGQRAARTGSIYDRVRTLHARLGRRVLIADLAEAKAEHEATTEIRRRQNALEQRRIAATPPTLPPGPAPIKACNGCGDQVVLGAGPVPGTLQAKCDCGRTSTVEAPLLARVRQARAHRSEQRPARKTRPTANERLRTELRLARMQLRVRALKALLAAWGDD